MTANSGISLRIPAHHLACCRCPYFRANPDEAWCELNQPDFPALCVKYGVETEKTALPLVNAGYGDLAIAAFGDRVEIPFNRSTGD